MPTCRLWRQSRGRNS
uniref:Uncharacterized protein n=1 Tax=Arundo donax TaxID=35708 RepID=A0A0A8Z0V5_ARUDO